MEIKYLGHSAFIIKTKEITIIIDPFDPEMVGEKWEKQPADLVLITHDHKDHNYIEGIEGSEKPENTIPTDFHRPFVIKSQGEYEVSGVHIFGFSAFHDGKGGAIRGKTTIYRIEADGFALVHLGDLGHKLTPEQAEEIGSVDILMIPVGGKVTIDPEIATEIIAELSPAFVLPCHYKTEKSKMSDLLEVSNFLKAIGGEPLSMDKLNLKTREDIPADTKVALLKI